MADDALLKAIQVGLSSTGPGSDVDEDAAAVAAVLVDHGMVLPVGVTIDAVYEVFRDGDRDGYEFTDRREAQRQARYGGQDGTPGEVRAAWRIQADGVDVITTWRSDG
jgi:hypothetical protein